MTTTIKQDLNEQADNEESKSIPIFGYELLRDILLPELFGKDTPEITYWAGKHLARKFPLLSMNEIHSFFHEAGWGQLYVLEEKKNEMKIELTGETVKRRFSTNNHLCFRLEAGFVAQQLQLQKQVVVEAIDEIHKKQEKAFLIVRWDRKDLINDM